jgi:hypothetical protein
MILPRYCPAITGKTARMHRINASLSFGYSDV